MDKDFQRILGYFKQIHTLLDTYGKLNPGAPHNLFVCNGPIFHVQCNPGKMKDTNRTPFELRQSAESVHLNFPALILHDNSISFTPYSLESQQVFFL